MAHLDYSSFVADKLIYLILARMLESLIYHYIYIHNILSITYTEMGQLNIYSLIYIFLQKVIDRTSSI